MVRFVYSPEPAVWVSKRYETIALRFTISLKKGRQDVDERRIVCLLIAGADLIVIDVIEGTRFRLTDELGGERKEANERSQRQYARRVRRPSLTCVSNDMIASEWANAVVDMIVSPMCV